MDTRSLLDKIATFPLIAEELAEDLLSGDFRSLFKGQGIEFDEVRPYEQGDDVRAIDWNVSARFGSPYVKQYREERELTVCIVLDCSASMRSGGASPQRYEQAVLAAAMVALSAEKAGQRVSAIFFDSEIRRVFPPRKGRAHAMAIILGALAVQPDGKGSSLGLALSGAGRLLKRRSLVVVVSDFLCVDWEHELGSLSRRHDVAAIKITDPVDTDMPDVGLVHIRDPETGIELHALTGFSSFRRAWSAWHEERSTAWRSLCRRFSVASLELSCADDPASSLGRFFSQRRRA